jgi:hypothetical protein
MPSLPAEARLLRGRRRRGLRARSRGRAARVVTAGARLGLAALVLAGLAPASAPGRARAAFGPATGTARPKAVNLVVTPPVRRAIRAAFVRAHADMTPSAIKGPLKGSVYYARYGRAYWALATFSLPRVGTTDQPEVFRRPAGGRWLDRGDTGGELCKVPRPVVAVWHLLDRRTGC